MFATRQDYLDGLSRVLFLTAVIFDARHPDDEWHLFPGFKLIDGSSRSIRAFVSKISASADDLATPAKMANEDADTFRANWPARIKRLNEAKLGGRMDLFLDWESVPDSI